MGVCGCPVVGHHHALAGGQPVVLDHVRRTRRHPARHRSRPGRSTSTDAAVGTPAARITSLANALDPSIRAAAAVGPNARIPRRSNSSTAPLTNGTSGPITTRSTPRVPASSAIERRVADRHRVGLRQSGGPGVAGGDVQLGDRRIAGQRAQQACSRAPEPMTRMRTVTEGTGCADRGPRPGRRVAGWPVPGAVGGRWDSARHAGPGLVRRPPRRRSAPRPRPWPRRRRPQARSRWCRPARGGRTADLVRHQGMRASLGHRTRAGAEGEPARAGGQGSGPGRAGQVRRPTCAGSSSAPTP